MRTPRKLTGTGHGTSLEHTLFIELAIIRQIDLETLGNHLAAIQHHDRVVQAGLTLQRRSDDDARSAIGSIQSELLDCLFASFDESALEHQILRRVTGNEKLGVKDEIGALTCSVRSSLAGFCQIALDITQHWIELGDGDTENVGIFAHNEYLSFRCSINNVG